MLRRDYLLRLIERAVEAIAKALGLLKRGDYDQALDQIGEGYDMLLKFDRDLLDTLHPRTIATMVGEPQLVRLVAQLCKLEGDLREERAEPHKALVCYRRALELYQEVGVGNEAADGAVVQALTERFQRRAKGGAGRGEGSKV